MPPTLHPRLAPAPAGTGPIAVRSFDLAATLNSGQVFHWVPDEDRGFLGLIDRTPIVLRQPETGCVEVTAGAEAAAAHYLALDHDLHAIIASFPADDAALARSVRFSPGLRLIRQPAWECLATFITSSLKQVPHITQISHTLRRRFGQPVAIGGHTLHTYPTAAAVADAGEAELRRCGLGYRAKHLAATAGLVATGELDLSFLTDPAVADDDALARLTRAPGVGPKVASCVLLFAGQRLGFFPIDVWIERTLRETYFPRRRSFPPGYLAGFARRHFGPYRGYAQQFLFHHARTHRAK